MTLACLGDVPSQPLSGCACIRFQLMEGIGPVVVGSAVGGLVDAAAFFTAISP